MKLVPKHYIVVTGIRGSMQKGMTKNEFDTLPEARRAARKFAGVPNAGVPNPNNFAIVYDDQLEVIEKIN